MIDSYRKLDALGDCMKDLGLNRQVAEDNEFNSGGAQYILKNIDADFWKKVFKSCIDIKLTLNSYNRRFFESENKGFQSWCADMWAVLWGIWARNAKTLCPIEMNFCWATDLTEKLEDENMYIYHNAGVTPQSIKHKDKFHKLFYKGDRRYTDNKETPFTNNENFSNVSSDFASIFYVREIQLLREKHYSHMPREKFQVIH
jgi:hypothetical protein